MRLVNADDAVNRFEELKPKGSSLDVRYAYGVSVGLEMAKHVTMFELSTVDAVPVVRCKDCKWFNKPGCAINIVDESDKPKETDFCSFGEQKDGDGNG